MQITLNQDEIHDALKDYVRQRISIKDNQNIEIDLKNGRGENGTTATINITSPNAKNAHSLSPPTDEQEEPEQDVMNEAASEDMDEPAPALF
jgi:hypothetical protein